MEKGRICLPRFYTMSWFTYLVAFGAFEGVELGTVLGKFDIDGL